MNSISALIVSLAFSFVICMLFCFLIKKNNKHHKKLLSCGIVALISSLLSVAAIKMIFQRWTIYEVIFIAAGLSLGAIFITELILSKERTNFHEVLIFCCAESIIVAIYSILTYGQATIHSDTATATLLSRSQIDNGTPFPGSWCYVNGSIWTIGISTVVAPFTFLLQNQSLARMLGSAVFVLITLVALIMSSKKLFSSDAWIIAIPVFLLFLNGQIDHVLYQGSYTGSMLWGVTIPALAFLSFYHSNKKAGILYALIVLILAIGGIGIFASHIIPLLGAIIVMWFISEKSTPIKKISTLRKIALLVLPAIIGYGIYLVIRGKLQINYVLNNTTGNRTEGIIYAASTERLWNNLWQYFSNYLICFGYFGNEKMISVPSVQNLISIGFCLLICVIVPILQGKKIREESRGVKFFYFYSQIHILIVFFMAVFFSLTIERYVLSSLFLLIIISTRYIYTYWLKEGTIIGRALGIGFIACMVFQSLILIGQSTNWTETVNQKKAFNQQLMDMGLTKGYASYWHAYNNEIYADLGIEYGAIEFDNGKIYEYDWLVDSNIYKPQGERTFLILEPFEEQLIAFDLQERFGQIQDSFSQDGLNIYVFDHDIASYFYHKGIYEALELLNMNNVTYEDGNYIIYPGGIVFGPADTIKKGRYRVLFLGDNMTEADCDIYSNTALYAISYKELSKDDNTIETDVTITEDINDIEFRMFNRTDNQTITLEKVIIQEIF